MLISPILAIAAFVLWLHAFPMSGYLMDTLFAFRGLDYFLPPLIIASLALPLLYRQERFGQLCRVCTFIVTPAPLLFTAFPGFGQVLLVLSGFCTPIVLLNCVLLVGQDRHPLKNLAFGIALGNVILAALLALPAAPILKALSVSLLLAAALPMRVEHSLQGAGEGIGEYLPFIAAFFFVSGLLYGDFLPEYDKLSFIPGIEIAVYISAVLATVMAVGEAHGPAPCPGGGAGHVRHVVVPGRGQGWSERRDGHDASIGGHDRSLRLLPDAHTGQQAQSHWVWHLRQWALASSAGSCSPGFSSNGLRS
jgi:hypothetical protein